jgi:3-phosphoshikimate 1-carboxyvinyltransferase
MTSTILLPKNPIPAGGAFGSVKIPGSKSVCNRALILAAMAQGESRLGEGLEADDTARMRECLRTLGIPVLETGRDWTVRGGAAPNASGPLPVGASGTTLRFLLPWLAFTARMPVRFEGDVRLFERPLGGLLDAIGAYGARWEALQGAGVLHPAPTAPEALDLEVDGTASSQFLTGLAQAAALLPGGGRLRWSRPPVSVSYLQLTVHWLGIFGCESRLRADGWEIPGGALRPNSLAMPGDWSGAAAFLCAAAVTGCRAQVAPLDRRDPQGDRALMDILEAAGCRLAWINDDTLTLAGPLQRGLHADLELCPDLGPVLAATAALAPAPSVLTGLQTLPLKECDRLDASAELVRWLGGKAEIIGDHTLKIFPGEGPGHRDPFNPRRDHRMAFAAALGGLRWGGELLDPGCVAKTLPRFWDDWAAMLHQEGTLHPEGTPA